MPCKYVYSGNLDKLKEYKEPSGAWRISPFLVFQAGDEEEGDDGMEYLEDVYNELKDKVKVPFFLTGIPVTVFVVAEV